MRLKHKDRNPSTRLTDDASFDPKGPNKFKSVVTSTLQYNNPHTLRNPKPVYSNFFTCMDESAQSMQYKTKVPTKTMLHWGQLKLLMSELECLSIVYEHMLAENNLYLSNGAINKPVVIYIGAAGGHHHPIIHEIFLEIDWVLVDPNPFKLAFDGVEAEKLKYVNKRAEFANRAHGRVIIINDYFTEEMALEMKKEFAGRMIIFISDIRRSGSGDTTEIFESRVLDDNLFQARCSELLEAEWSYFKFRTPYFSVQNANSFEYPNGVVYYQTRQGATSSETRYMYRGQGGKKREFNFERFSDQLFRYNECERCNLYSHGIANRAFDKCADCALEAQIWARCVQLQYKLRAFADKNKLPHIVAPVTRKLQDWTHYVVEFMEKDHPRPHVVFYNHRGFVTFYMRPKYWIEVDGVVRIKNED